MTPSRPMASVAKSVLLPVRDVALPESRAAEVVAPRMPPGVQLRGAVYWHRVTIPKDLRHLYPRTRGGKLRTTHSYVSLETGDAAQAALRASWRKADLEAEFIAKREQAKAQSVRLVPTPELVSMLADRVRFRILAGDGARRRSGEPARMEGLAPSAHPMQRLGSQRVMEGVVSTALGGLAGVADPRFGRQHADFEAEKLGIAVDWTGQDVALAHLTRVAVRAHADAARRTEGALVADPARPAAAGLPAATGPVRLADIVPHWQARRRPTADAVRRAGLALRRLAESGMDKPVHKYRQVDGIRLRGWFRSPDRGFGEKTARNLWHALGALMNTAVECGKIERNPWAGLSFEAAAGGSREAFTPAQLRTLFGSRLFAEGTYPPLCGVAPWEAYHLLLLGLWTGARVGELGRLRVADLQQDDGIAVLAVRAQAGEHSASRANVARSARTLPLAPELVRLGLLDFVADQGRAGQEWLFPSLHQGGRRPAGEVFSQWFKGYRQDLGLPAGALHGFDGFRRTVRDALAAHGAAPEIADALLGHKPAGAARVPVPPGAVLAALQRPLYPFLWLPRRYPAG